MASSGKGGLHGLTDDELRVMKYFAKTGGSRTVKSVVSGVERYTFNVDALSDPNEDLYHDRADVEVAVRSLVERGLLSEKDGKYCVTAKVGIRYVDIYVQTRGEELYKFLRRHKHSLAYVLAVGLPATAALVYIITQTLSWLDP